MMDIRRRIMPILPVVGWWRVLYDSRLDPCLQCGAWTWTQNGPLLMQDRLRCGECSHEASERDLLAGGRD